MNPASAVVAAPPAPAEGDAADDAAGDPAGCCCPLVVSRDALTRAQIGMAVAAAAFALFASTLRPATFPHLPAQCVATRAEAMELSYYAGLLLLSAMAQAGAATAALITVPPSRAGRFLAGVANVLGLVTLGHLMQVVSKVLSATGVFCFIGRLRTAELIIHALFANTFLLAVPVLWTVGQPQGRD